MREKSSKLKVICKNCGIHRTRVRRICAFFVSTCKRVPAARASSRYQHRVRIELETTFFSQKFFGFFLRRNKSNLTVWFNILFELKWIKVKLSSLIVNILKRKKLRSNEKKEI